MSQQHTYPQTTSIVMVIVERATFNTNTPFVGFVLNDCGEGGGKGERAVFNMNIEIPIV